MISELDKLHKCWNKDRILNLGKFQEWWNLDRILDLGKFQEWWNLDSILDLGSQMRGLVDMVDQVLSVGSLERDW